MKQLNAIPASVEERIDPRSNVFTEASSRGEETRKASGTIPHDNAKRRPKLGCNATKVLGTRMTLKAKDLSPDQKMAIESLLGRSRSVSAQRPRLPSLSGSRGPGKARKSRG